MTLPHFEANVRYQPGLATIDLWGDLNAGAERALNAAYLEAESRNPSIILLNFSQVKYINSAGIGLLIGLLAQARQKSRQLIAFGLRPQYIEIFALTRLAEFMETFPDEASALAEASLLTDRLIEKQ
jgi:anti-anti-sigma factor